MFHFELPRVSWKNTGSLHSADETVWLNNQIAQIAQIAHSCYLTSGYLKLFADGFYRMAQT